MFLGLFITSGYTTGPNTEANIPKVKNISPGKFLRNRKQIQWTFEYTVPVNLLKMIPDLIILPLCQIINMSFLTGLFPEKLGIVKVIPVHKNGSTQDMNNFRPISLLSIFDRIMEKQCILD